MAHLTTNSLRPCFKRKLIRTRVIICGVGDQMDQFWANVETNPKDFPQFAALTAGFDAIRADRMRITAYGVTENETEVDSGLIIGSYDPDRTVLFNFDGVLNKANAKMHSVKSFRHSGQVLADFKPTVLFDSGGEKEAVLSQDTIFDTSRPLILEGYAVGLKMVDPVHDPTVKRRVLVTEELWVQVYVSK